MGGKFGKAITLVIAIVGFVCSVRAQTDERKVEIGGQFSILRFSTESNGIPAITGDDSVTDYGFGGRVGYNFNKNFGFDSEVNFFPKDRLFEGGRKTQFLAGIKAGGRSDKFGLYAKARPGLVHFSEGDYRLVGGGVCIAISPAPFGCFEPTGKTNFAFDAGGIVEFYPTQRTIVRVDVGDTMIRYGNRNVAGVTTGPGPTQLVIFSVPSETVHNFQTSIGFSFRF